MAVLRRRSRLPSYGPYDEAAGEHTGAATCARARGKSIAKRDRGTLSPRYSPRYRRGPRRAGKGVRTDSPPPDLRLVNESARQDGGAAGHPGGTGRPGRGAARARGESECLGAAQAVRPGGA